MTQEREPARPSIVYLCFELLGPQNAARTHVTAIVEGMQRRGARVVLVSPDDALATRSRLGRLRDYVTLTWRALRILHGADIAYVRSHPAAFVFAGAARLVGRKVVHEINGRMVDLAITYRLSGLVARTLSALQRAQYRRAAALVSVTPGLADWAHVQVKSDMPIEVIPNAADPERFGPAARTDIAVEGDYVLFVGTLQSWHGVQTMIDAAADPAWPPTCRLAIVGRGGAAARVREAAAANPRILALGELPQPDAAGLAAGALANLVQIEVDGGRGETGVAPIKLYEAMASGRPVIATDLPFQRDIVAQAMCGIVIPPADPSHLAQAVRRLHDDRVGADAMGRHGREAVLRGESWQHRADQTLALLARLLPGPPRCA